jgi:hypothetical protein
MVLFATPVVLKEHWQLVTALKSVPVPMPGLLLECLLLLLCFLPLMLPQTRMFFAPSTVTSIVFWREKSDF